MGAYNPPPTLPDTPKPKPGLLIFAAVSVLLLLAYKWRDVVEYIEGVPHLKRRHQEELQKKLSRPDEAEQYALLANVDGWYACLHSGRVEYYLRTGEVWKYGVTAKGERRRYTAQFLQEHNVSYIAEFVGTLKQCLDEEQRKLYTYPVLPENLARPEEDRLIRPPYNPIFR